MANPKLNVGDPAPPFELPGDDGLTHSLEAHEGQKIVLYFYPKDDTPGCTKEACDFRDSLEQLTALGAVVLGVSPDSVKRHEKFREKYDLTFPLLADEENAAAEAYGVWRTKKNYGREYMGIVRSTFLIDEEGTIRELWDNVRVHRKKKGEMIRHVDVVREAIESLDG